MNVKETMNILSVDENLSAATVKHKEKKPLTDKQFEQILELVKDVLLGIGGLIFVFMYFAFLTGFFTR